MMHLYWVALKSIWAKEIHRFMRILGADGWCRQSSP